MITPKTIQLIEDEVAIIWSDGEESYYKMETLRAQSPSAEQVGERDLTGRVVYGGTDQKTFPGVRVTGWSAIGGYAVQFEFSDGHRTGIYTFSYLRQLASAPEG